VLPVCGALLAMAGQELLAQDKVNPGSAAVADFEHRVADYVKLHKTIRSRIHGLKPTNSPEEIARHEERLAHDIREARHGAVQGNIFTPEITAEFRRLIGLTMQGQEAGRIRESLKRAEPVRLPEIHIDRRYPEALPLQSTPPSLLLNLPQLPPELDYRVVGKALILRDVEANLIVDYIPNAVP
jgi:hypothetical protein